MTMPMARKAAGMMTTARAVSSDAVPLGMVRYSVSRLFVCIEMPLSEPQSQLTQLRKKSSLPPETLWFAESSVR